MYDMQVLQIRRPRALREASSRGNLESRAQSWLKARGLRLSEAYPRYPLGHVDAGERVRDVLLTCEVAIAEVRTLITARDSRTKRTNSGIRNTEA